MHKGNGRRGVQSAQSPSADMTFNCGVLFSKLKRGLMVTPTPTPPHPDTSAPSHTDTSTTPTTGSATNDPGSACGKNTKVEDNRMTLLLTSSDWSEFEGVLAQGER
ncbi:hypothetical protein ACOMHN_004152 [Nucella lapillus]